MKRAIDRLYEMKTCVRTRCPEGRREGKARVTGSVRIRALDPFRRMRWLVASSWNFWGRTLKTECWTVSRNGWRRHFCWLIGDLISWFVQSSIFVTRKSKKDGKINPLRYEHWFARSAIVPLGLCKLWLTKLFDDSSLHRHVNSLRQYATIR